ncbi:hypothetical protein GCM10010987_62150 [Bradyrhizobium guangdongense]|uniref:Uncharacterized protein n=1 Tax=Bradyrhizobium guangdongense TaxID=1325090 RepID=A0AA87W918_9BRAD|nr:hypothetical protein GCM10010987_62150 [Bradyrhizobium guangdongense]
MTRPATMVKGGTVASATLISVKELPQISESNTNSPNSSDRVVRSEIARGACMLMRFAPGSFDIMLRTRWRGLAEFGPHRPIESDFGYSEHRDPTMISR